MSYSLIRQVFFKLICLLLFFNFFLIPLYSSKIIEIYYQKNIHSLDDSISPKIIHYIDTSNYSKQDSLKITGVLFTYKDQYARKVFFISNIHNFRHVPMLKNRKGIWFYVLPINSDNFKRKSEREIRYKFLVDGSFQIDQKNKQNEYTSSNKLASIYYLKNFPVQLALGISERKAISPYEKQVFFRIYNPHAKRVSLVGNFNSWNSELDKMEKKEGGYFEIRKILPPGEYIYLYKIDENYVLDSQNENKKADPVYNIVSYIKIK